AGAVDNAADAIDAVLQEHYDLALMDCVMPVMNGFEATRRIRESIGESMPIIAMTADAMPSDRGRCLREGMNGYLAKPVDLRVLADTLARWLPASGAVKPAQAPAEPAGDRKVALFNEQDLLRLRLRFAASLVGRAAVVTARLYYGKDAGIRLVSRYRSPCVAGVPRRAAQDDHIGKVPDDLRFDGD